ncbi:efflux RND transporter periplasmic adaptor subunit [Desulfonatronovibrio hydrogenovorans]|uniref:efflux RND transporter periplasmic adaptor subunit n=1 Tax=Desulfonatronovibrio hydrogenovorans TaxID=53245 RepID=UPI0013783F3A|nr:HlyD family secretion protein [Desulfonatronovibrio hydrogenovorans]
MITRIKSSDYSRTAMNYLKQIAFTAAAVLVTGLIVGMLSGCQDDQSSRDSGIADPFPVTSPAAYPDRTRIVLTGLVEPVQEIRVHAPVPARIEYVSPRLDQGEIIAAQEEIIILDSQAQRSAFKSAQNRVLRAEQQLALLEHAVLDDHQDWKLFQTRRYTEPDPLLVYAPQLEKARQEMTKARNELTRARRELDGTVIRFPFPCLVVSSRVSAGEQVTPDQSLAVLIPLDRARIMAHIPSASAGWLNISEINDQSNAPRVKIRLMGDHVQRFRAGKVTRTIERLDPETGMTGIVVEFIDPYGFDDHPGDRFRIPLGSVVELEITSQAP